MPALTACEAARRERSSKRSPVRSRKRLAPATGEQAETVFSACSLPVSCRRSGRSGGSCTSVHREHSGSVTTYSMSWLVRQWKRHELEGRRRGCR
ncbi:MAG TPA: hypothetical protein VE733_28965 [Streptosporangiaceae bacterium]|nr:hypothetical protein [Streptosporangiaceae bacterium]